MTSRSLGLSESLLQLTTVPSILTYAWLLLLVGSIFLDLRGELDCGEPRKCGDLLLWGTGS